VSWVVAQPGIQKHHAEKHRPAFSALQCRLRETGICGQGFLPQAARAFTDELPCEAFGVRPACWRCRKAGVVRKREQAPRTPDASRRSVAAPPTRAPRSAIPPDRSSLRGSLVRWKKTDRIIGSRSCSPSFHDGEVGTPVARRPPHLPGLRLGEEHPDGRQPLTPSTMAPHSTPTGISIASLPGSRTPAPEPRFAGPADESPSPLPKGRGRRHSALPVIP